MGTRAEWEGAGEYLQSVVGAGRWQGKVRVTAPCCFVSLDAQILVWHTRTEKPVLVNEGKKGFTDPTVEI